ncbi:hypothetical protein SLS62_002592 [Diatrype stigma]|uniref:ABC transporter domain-containing protein n=1 Tax=Diatrype stigma TaxID=117547 RepID=A0AAN9UZV6_9PEZI
MTAKAVGITAGRVEKDPAAPAWTAQQRGQQQQQQQQHSHEDSLSGKTADDLARVATNDDDPESGFDGKAHLLNTTVHTLAWREVTVTVKDQSTKELRNIVDNVEGIVEAGEICALMGPSGCGKTTLLNVLAQRDAHARQVAGAVLVNGDAAVPLAAFRDLSCFVEQEDALIGSLTVRETIDFAARLSTRSSVLPAKERVVRINTLLDAFGLRNQADTLIGTPIRKGISGGQKRRVGVASQLITSPRILFLDEPTSGLDSAASWEVINYLRGVAEQYKLIVIASIHQPSTSTFNLFDKLLLLSNGKPHYFGPVDKVAGYYAALGHPMPNHTNPAEFLLELVNTDFSSGADPERSCELVNTLATAWESSAQCQEVRKQVAAAAAATATAMTEPSSGSGSEMELTPRPMPTAPAHEHYRHHQQHEHERLGSKKRKPGSLSLIATLLHRSFIKSYRDVVAYGIRIAMYTGLAIMMGTVWLRLSTDQASIIPFTNAIFFAAAFMSFMAVAYVPAFLEDRAQYVKEHHNGLYGATELIVSNFLIGIPYLFFISILFSAISYHLINLRPGGAPAFFTWVLWLFLDLLAAESLVVLFASLFPSFVVALALVAFANGLWMSVGGFLVQPTALNAFYRYAFHYWDYQKWVFEGMMVNEFGGRVYECARVPASPAGNQQETTCACMWLTELADRCQIAGQGVLDQYGYQPGHMGRNVGIMLAIVAGYRIAAWVVLKLRKS